MIIEAGSLRMDLDTGTVSLIDEDGDSADCGHVEGTDDAPEGHEADWDALLDTWRDAGRAAVGYAAAVDYSYFNR